MANLSGKTLYPLYDYDLLYDIDIATIMYIRATPIINFFNDTRDVSIKEYIPKLKERLLLNPLSVLSPKEGVDIDDLYSQLSTGHHRKYIYTKFSGITKLGNLVFLENKLRSGISPTILYQEDYELDSIDRDFKIVPNIKLDEVSFTSYDPIYLASYKLLKIPFIVKLLEGKNIYLSDTLYNKIFLSEPDNDNLFDVINFNIINIWGDEIIKEEEI